MSYIKSVPTGASGNTRLLKSYGGGSKGPRQAYASGGAVKGMNSDGPALEEGMSASGSPAKPNLARAGRKMSKKGGKKDDKDEGGKKGTTVNVVIAGGGGKGPDGPPMGGPPMPPTGAGGPPMMPPPMRASGGRVHSDAAEDKKMVAEMIHKHEKEDHKGTKMTRFRKGGMACRSVGGPASPPRGFDAGAGGARGRLEKRDKYGK